MQKQKFQFLYLNNPRNKMYKLTKLMNQNIKVEGDIHLNKSIFLWGLYHQIYNFYFT